MYLNFGWHEVALIRDNLGQKSLVLLKRMTFECRDSREIRAHDKVRITFSGGPSDCSQSEYKCGLNGANGPEEMD